MDALAMEPQFLDHIAPIWRRLPDEARGRLIVERSLLNRAVVHHRLEAEGLDASAMRLGSAPPRADPGGGPAALAASYGDIKVGRRLGYRRFAFVEHGIGQSYAGVPGPGGTHGSYAGGEDREDVALFLVPNEHCAGRWRAAYPGARVEVVGSPRLDDLPARGGAPGPVLCVSFHWNASFIAPEAGTAFQAFVGQLPGLARESGMGVIGHAHPRLMARLVERYRRAGIEAVTDFDEVLRRADVYACDNSSTLYEFAATGRPVVVMNAPQYRRHVEHGLRFWEAAGVGVQVGPSGSLAAAARIALADRADLASDRAAALRLVYGGHGNAAVEAAALVAGMDSV